MKHFNHRSSMIITAELNTDILWHNASIFKKPERASLRPNWNGSHQSGMGHV